MQYAPITIKNPITRGHSVKLLPNQKLSLAITSEEYKDVEVNVGSDFLFLERSDASRGVIYHFAQHEENLKIVRCGDSTFYMGEIHVVGRVVNASLCVYLEPPQAQFRDVVRVVNPSNQLCKLETHQFLDVSIFADASYFDHLIQSGVSLWLEFVDYKSFPVDSSLCYPLRKKYNCGSNYLTEHVFRFKYSERTLQTLQTLPSGRYDAGRIVFRAAGRSYSTLDVMLNWRGRNKGVPRALVIPHPPKQKHHHRQPMAVKTTIRKLDVANLEDGCNVVFSKCC